VESSSTEDILAFTSATRLKLSAGGPTLMQKKLLNLGLD
jgi:hypothetical protein